jgi:hypothetical protein
MMVHFDCNADESAGFLGASWNRQMVKRIFLNREENFVDKPLTIVA